MSRQLHLFELINSLTKAEKRYFKLHASRNVTGEKNSYVQLFDLLDSMQTFDKAKLDKALTADLSISNLSVANEYLFNAILESLELFNRGHSIDQQLAGQLAQAAILRDKGLYAPSFLLLIKAERLAQRHERFTALVDIYGLMRTLMATNRFSETGSHDLPSVLSGALISRPRNPTALGGARDPIPFSTYTFAQRHCEPRSAAHRPESPDPTSCVGAGHAQLRIPHADHRHDHPQPVPRAGAGTGRELRLSAKASTNSAWRGPKWQAMAVDCFSRLPTTT
jgi:hypothetical protein